MPADRPATSIGVCWYVANRLVASATLDTKGAGTVLRGAAAASGLFSASGSAACTRDDQSDAVVLAVRYVGGGTAEGVLHLGRCPSRSATDSQDGFVRNLARLAGMPLTLG